MSAGDWFGSSVVGWSADQPDRIMVAIANESGIPLDEMFRPDEVNDATLGGTVHCCTTPSPVEHCKAKCCIFACLPAGSHSRDQFIPSGCLQPEGIHGTRH